MTTISNEELSRGSDIDVLSSVYAHTRVLMRTKSLWYFLL